MSTWTLGSGCPSDKNISLCVVKLLPWCDNFKYVLGERGAGAGMTGATGTEGPPGPSGPAGMGSHYYDVILIAMASQITIVYSTFYSGADQRKHQNSVSLAFVVNSPHKRPVTRKMIPFGNSHHGGVVPLELRIILRKDLHGHFWNYIIHPRASTASVMTSICE